jgi:hypothetical protein
MTSLMSNVIGQTGEDHLERYNNSTTPRTSSPRKEVNRSTSLTDYYEQRIRKLEQDSIVSRQDSIKNLREINRLNRLIAAKEKSEAARMEEQVIMDDVLLSTSIERDIEEKRADSLQVILFYRDSMDVVVERFYFNYLKAYPAYERRRSSKDRETDDFEKWEKVIVEFELGAVGNQSFPGGKFEIMVQDEQSGEYLFHEEGNGTNKISFNYYGGMRQEKFSVRNTKNQFASSRTFIVRLYYEGYPNPIGSQKIELE